ncbi:MAG: hypothetical protein H8D97_01635 [Proteobacteria bacterium]|nr:hypothetical protein [Pseudomonadota bacterium]
MGFYTDYSLRVNPRYDNQEELVITISKDNKDNYIFLNKEEVINLQLALEEFLLTEI